MIPIRIRWGFFHPPLSTVLGYAPIDKSSGNAYIVEVLFIVNLVHHLVDLLLSYFNVKHIYYCVISVNSIGKKADKMEMGNGEKIYQTMQKFHKLGISSKFSGEMPRSEIMMLKVINLDTSKTEGVTISALSERLKISKSAVSQMINVLEDKGYVERITTKNDRRIVYVRLTEIGEQSLEKSLRSLLESLNQVFVRMGDEDTETLLRLLNKLYVIVEDYKKP